MNALMEARKKAGIKQADMAKKIGMKQQDISKYENCIRRLDVVEFLEICQVLDVDYKKLLQETDSGIRKK